jgi:hypothetical protein
MAWRRHELNAEPAEIEDYGIQNIYVRLASIASAGTDLSEFERAAENPVGLFGKTIRESQRFPVGEDQVIPVAGRESILRSETDRSFRTCVGTLRAEQTATEIDLQTSVGGDCLGRASIRATRAIRRASSVIQDG